MQQKNGSFLFGDCRRYLLERLQDVKTNLSVYAEALAEVAEKPLSEPLVPFSCQAADIAFKEYYAFLWMGHTVEMFFTPSHCAPGHGEVMKPDMVLELARGV